MANTRNGNSPASQGNGSDPVSLADQIGIATREQLVPGVYGSFAVFDADTPIVVRPSTRNNQNNIFPNGLTRDSLATTIGKMWKTVPEYLTRYHGHLMNNQADSKMGTQKTADEKAGIVFDRTQRLHEWRTARLKMVEDGTLGTTRVSTVEPVEEREQLARLAAYDILKPLCVAAGMTMPDKPRNATWETVVNGKPLLEHAKAILASPMGADLYAKADKQIEARKAAVTTPEGVNIAALMGFAPTPAPESPNGDDDEDVDTDDDDTGDETPENRPTP